MPTIGEFTPALFGPCNIGSFNLQEHVVSVAALESSEAATEASASPPTIAEAQNVVVYFYPKDMTPGCTTEANDFKSAAADFAATNTLVIGVSKDSVARHIKFVEKHALNFKLLSDADLDNCERWGVWQEKKNYGRTYMGIVRSTYLIDRSGVVRNAWPKARVKGHVAAVLEAAQQLHAEQNAQ